MIRSLWPLMSVFLALLASGVAACGKTGESANSRSVMAPSAAVPDHTPAMVAAGTASTARNAGRDKDDDDSGRLPNDDDNSAVWDYGHPATAAEERSVTALVKRYYAVAVAGDGGRACSMIESGLAKAVPLDYGKFGPSYLHAGKTCAAVLALLFEHEHERLAADVPHLTVKSVRVESHHGLVLLASGETPEREIEVQWDRGVWKLSTLLDGELP